MIRILELSSFLFVLLVRAKPAFCFDLQTLVRFHADLPLGFGVSLRPQTYAQEQRLDIERDQGNQLNEDLGRP